MFEVIRAHKEYLPVIRELANIIFPHTYSALLTPQQIDYMMEWMYSPASLQKQMDDGQYFFLLMSDRKPVGFMTVEPQGELLFHLQKIYVLPSQQGKGAGRVLINTAENLVRSLISEGKIAALELNVNRGNPAVSFYKKMGFEIDRQGDFPIGNGFYMNDYIMKKEVG